ncbi:MAG: amino acid adenylation domain-containing protein [Alcaligenes sp.]
MMNPSTIRRYPRNFVEHLRYLACDRPEDVALTVVGERNGLVVDSPITYVVLEMRVRALSAQLQSRFAVGERALLLLDNDDHYAVAFLACMYAGLIAVPVFPPESMRPQHLSRLSGIAQDAQARCVLTLAAVQQAMVQINAFPGASVLAVDTVDLGAADTWSEYNPNDEEIAFLQYTSGSTGAPKGVMVTHANLMANERVMEQTLGLRAEDVFSSWLPLYHDMGLIGGLLQPIHRGAPLVLMTPRFFLERPQRWLEAVTRHHATVTGGPDFAFRLCLDRIKDAQVKALDLSSWRIAYTGAEPVRQDTLVEFGARFASCGFDTAAFQPCYGLAEATLFITGGREQSQVVSGTFSTEALSRGDASDAREGSVLIGCGCIADGHDLQISDPVSFEALPDGRVGEIWATGPSIASGYWENPVATQETFVERDRKTWLRTGDLGFMRDGQLFVTGRIKDIIIVRGHNLYPQDIERAIEREVDAVRVGRVSAFAVNGPNGEAIGVAAEVSRSMQRLVEPIRLVEMLGAVVSDLCGEPLSVVALLQPGELPKTSSGKLQRQAARQGILERTLEVYALWEHGAFVSGENESAEEYAVSVDDQLERELTEIWRAALHLNPGVSISGDSHFFLLGGNSLEAIQVTGDIAARWRVDLPPAVLFQKPRLAELADAVRLAISEGRARSPIAVISQSERSQPQALSHAQTRQWFLWRLDPTNTAYHVATAVSLSGKLNINALRTAIHSVIARHEALRTVFAPGADDTGEQIILPSLDIDIPLVDLSNVPTSVRSDQVDEVAASMNVQPFDLLSGPLLRIGIIRLQPTEHRVVVIMHHIVSDAVSVKIFFDELADAYVAAKEGREPVLSVPTVQYADYAAWQRKKLQTDEMGAQLSYWREHLGNDHPVLGLPTDGPREPVANYQAQFHRFDLPAPLTASLREAVRAQGVTLATFMLAAFQALLYRYTGQGEVRIGVPSANRHEPGTGAVVGFFVNTLVLRNVLNGRKPLSEVLAQAHDAMLGAQAHPDVPFELLVDVLHPSRSLAHSPLFQVLFNHLREDFELFQIRSGLSVRREHVGGQAAQFELSFDSTEREDGGVGVVLTYAAELFEPPTIARMAEHYCAVLQALIRTPDMQLGSVTLMNETECSELSRWAKGPPEQGDGIPVHMLIERTASVQPDSIAVRFCDESLTYTELNARANKLAHRLISLDVRPDTVVAVALDRSIELVVTLLAVLKAGGAYLPLELDQPNERLAHMLADSGAQLVVSMRETAPRLPSMEGVQFIMLDELELSGESDGNPSVHVDNEQLAYVIYTSGSTGKPKGVGNRHRSLSNRLAWMQAAYGLEVGDTVLQKTPYGFDVSVWEFFWPLVIGASLVVAMPGDHRDPGKLVVLMRSHGVTTAHFVPSMLQEFLEHPGVEAITTLRRIVCSGEALPTKVQAALFERLPAVSLHNLYGPTEAAIDVTHWTCRDDGRRQIPIGEPIAGVQTMVLDEDLGVVPQGVVGELYLGGVGLARGYINSTSLTAERFVADPFDSRGGRLYRTGDLVRWNQEGQLEFQGRRDHQVKIRGLRVELGEIEAELLRQSEVKQAAVIVDQYQDGARLVAYVSPHDGKSVESGMLRQRLAAVLPDYMVPGLITVIDDLPLNASGKLDRNALPRPEWTRGGPIEVPQGKVGAALAEIWAEVLDHPVDRIGAKDNFFDLGGHSLALVRAHRLMIDRLGAAASLMDLFRYPTIAALAAHIESGANPSESTGRTNKERALRRRDALLQRRQTVTG